MKKVAIIVAAVIGIGTTAAVAQARPADITQAEYQALVAQQQHHHGLQVPVKGENYYARGIPNGAPTTPTAAPTTSTDFQWGDAAIGAGTLFGLAALAAMGIGLRRHRFHLGTS